MRTGERIPLDLSFKGDRKYLHGTDMIDALQAYFPKMSDISLRIQKLAKWQLAVVRLPDPRATRRDMTAVMTALCDGVQVEIGFIELDGNLPGRRYRYDEDDVLRNAKIEETICSARLRWNQRYSFIEQLVALHKRLLEKCVNASEVRWYFTRLEIDSLPFAVDNISLVITEALGTKLVRSAVKVDGKPFGSIYFSGVAT